MRTLLKSKRPASLQKQIIALVKPMVKKWQKELAQAEARGTDSRSSVRAAKPARK